MGGVYKLGAIHNGQDWNYRIKLSNDVIKVSNPGCLNLVRHSDHDLLFNEFDEKPETPPLLQSRLKNGMRTQPAEKLTNRRDRALASWQEHRQQSRELRLTPTLQTTKDQLIAQYQK